MSARPALRRSARVQAAKSATAGASEHVSAVSVAAQSAALGESAAETRERAAPDGPQERAETRESAAPDEPEERAAPRQQAEGERAAKRCGPATESRGFLGLSLVSEAVVQQAQGVLADKPASGEDSADELEFSWGDGVETEFRPVARDFSVQDAWTGKQKICKSNARKHFLLGEGDLSALSPPVRVPRQPFGEMHLYKVAEVRAAAQAKANKEAADAASALKNILMQRQQQLTKHKINPGAISNVALRKWAFGDFSDARAKGNFNEARRRFAVAIAVQRHFTPAVQGKEQVRRVAELLHGKGKLLKKELKELKDQSPLARGTPLRRWLIKRLIWAIDVAKALCDGKDGSEGGSDERGEDGGDESAGDKSVPVLKGGEGAPVRKGAPVLKGGKGAPVVKGCEGAPVFKGTRKFEGVLKAFKCCYASCFLCEADAASLIEAYPRAELKLDPAK
jgi:hypothetical protein